jgi:hypothetical protein
VFSYKSVRFFADNKLTKTKLLASFLVFVFAACVPLKSAVAARSNCKHFYSGETFKGSCIQRRALISLAAKSNPIIILGENETTNPVELSSYGLKIGTYRIRLRPLLDRIASHIKLGRVGLLDRAPFHRKIWRGWAPRPFPDFRTRCWEITVPPISAYFEPLEGSKSIAMAVRHVENQEKARIVCKMKTQGRTSKEENKVATMITKRRGFCGRGPVRLFIDQSCTQYCLSLFHDYSQGFDGRCIFAPFKPLPLWTVERKQKFNH